MQRSNRAEGEKEEANSLKSRGLWRGLRKIWRDVLICDTVASCDKQDRLYSGRLIPSFFILLLLYRIDLETINSPWGTVEKMGIKPEAR